MDVDAVRGLISRRGSVVGWSHALPPPPSSLNPLTGNVHGPGLAGIGSTIRNEGAMGELYSKFFNIRAYFTNKTSQSSFQQFGIVEQGDAQLDIAVPFVPEPEACIDGLPPALLDDYNHGRFAIIRGQDNVTYDRFTIDSTPWVAKAVPVPLVDSNVTFAYRILICKETY